MINATAIMAMRRARNMNQDQLAELVGVCRQTISHYETGRRTPDKEMLQDIAGALGVPTLNLLEASVQAALAQWYVSLDAMAGVDKPRKAAVERELANRERVLEMMGLERYAGGREQMASELTAHGFKPAPLAFPATEEKKVAQNEISGASQSVYKQNDQETAPDVEVLSEEELLEGLQIEVPTISRVS